MLEGTGVILWYVLLPCTPSSVCCSETERLSADGCSFWTRMTAALRIRTSSALTSQEGERGRRGELAAEGVVSCVAAGD